MSQVHDETHTAETCGECQRNRAAGTLTVHYWEPSPLDRATQLGTEHGTAAAKAWWADRAENIGIRTIGYLLGRRATADLDLPEPDLTGVAKLLGAALDKHEAYVTSDEIDAYCTAFGAAVEATIRAEVTS